MNNSGQLTLKVAYPRNVNSECKVNNYLLMNRDMFNNNVVFICSEISITDIKSKLVSLVNKV